MKAPEITAMAIAIVMVCVPAAGSGLIIGVAALNGDAIAPYLFARKKNMTLTEGGFR